MKIKNMAVVLTAVLACVVFVQTQHPRGHVHAQNTSNVVGGYTGASDYAPYSGAGGYVDSSPRKTVAQAKKMKDNELVSLQGKITKRIKKDKYVFTDNTGSVNIEIDSDVWKGLTVGPNDVVIIYGEVDKGIRDFEIEVEKIEKQ